MKILTRHFDTPGFRHLNVYLQHGGYEAVKKALSMEPEAIIDEVKRANLVGLGGAGFPAGVKWGFVPKDPSKTKYLVVNGDEGEPGTFKDRYLMERAPHQLLEGMIICSYAVGIHKAYIYVRGEYVRQIKILRDAIHEAEEAGLLGKNILGSGFDLQVVVHPGAGGYICGEETGLIESLEGKKGFPRIKPPFFPATMGVLGCPTVINNVETISHLPHIILKGSEWFASLGAEKSGGTRIFSVSGHVKRPGIYELPMGTRLREIIYDHCGGTRDDHPVKAVIPGGISCPVLTAGQLDVRMDFVSLREAGSMAGSGAIVVMDDTTCMVDVCANIARFFAHESCGQCTPCREGTGWLAKILDRIHAGQGRSGDIENAMRIAQNMMGVTICLLAEGAAMPILSYLTRFRSEFEYHVEMKQCDVKRQQQ